MWLAKKWTPSTDLKQFTFELDPKATFADGSPVEAKDVQWSWNRLKNLKGSAAYFMDDVTSIDIQEQRGPRWLGRQLMVSADDRCERNLHLLGIDERASNRS